jgi:hypothetical protein
MKVIRNLVLIPFGLIIGLTVDGFEQPQHAGTTMAAIHVATARGGTTTSERVPFVGCESGSFDGDDLPAPKDRGYAPALPRSVADKLAYYASAEKNLTVLAPRGWHCFGYSYVDATILVVTPELPSGGYEWNGTGPGIKLSLWDGMISGRFAVARVAARLFPTKKKFVKEVEGEGAEDFPFGPYPDDILTRRSDTDVEFETPAHKDGMGTSQGLVKDADPIHGRAIISAYKNEAPSVMLLAVRMPPDLRRLVRTIMEMR